MSNDDTSESLPPEKKDIFFNDVTFSPDLSIRVDYQVKTVKLFILTPTLSDLEILHDATLKIQNRLVLKFLQTSS